MQSSFHPQPGGHPGMQHGQPMGMPGGPHAPGQVIPHMQMGIGAPNGAHMAQNGQMMVNMHPGGGMGGPGQNNAHALSHLSVGPQVNGQIPQAFMRQGMQPGMQPGAPHIMGQAQMYRNQMLMQGGQPPLNMMMGPGNMTPAQMNQIQQQQIIMNRARANGMLPNGMQMPQNINLDMQRQIQQRAMQQQQQQNMMQNMGMQHAQSQQGHPGQPMQAPQMRPQASMQGVRESLTQGPHLPQQPPQMQQQQPQPAPQLNPGTPQQPQRIPQQQPSQGPPQQPPPHATPIQAPTPAPNRQATATPQQPQPNNQAAQQQAMQQQAMQQHMQQQQQAMLQQSQQQQAQQQAQQQLQAQQAAQKQAQSDEQPNPQQPQPNQGQAPGPAAAQQQMQAVQQHQQALQTQEVLRRNQHMMQQQAQHQRMATVTQSALSKLVNFTDKLGMFSASQARPEQILPFWQGLIAEFFADDGIFRAALVDKHTPPSDHAKPFDISAQVLPRFFHETNKAGVERMQISMSGAYERKTNEGVHLLESQKSTFAFWYGDGTQVVWIGSMRAIMNSGGKFTLFDFSPDVAHEEYLPRAMVEKILDPESPIATKTSPNVTKGKKQQKAPFTRVTLPESPVGSLGVSSSVQQFLEHAQTMSLMRDLLLFSNEHDHLAPHLALEQLNEQRSQPQPQPQSQPGPPPNMQMIQANIQNAMQANAQAAQLAGMQANMNTNMQSMQPPGMRTPGLNGPQGGNQFASPAQMNLNLPAGRMGNMVSPRMAQDANQGGMMAAPMAPPMVAQRSQQGNTSSATASTNASPNTASKRRRASTIKAEQGQDDGDLNGLQQPKVKPSPKVGGKRQKGNAS